MLDYYFDIFAPAYGVTAFQPQLLQWEPVYADVELQGSLTLGATVPFFGRPNAPAPNVLAAVGVEAERFVQLFLQRLAEHYA